MACRKNGKEEGNPWHAFQVVLKKGGGGAGSLSSSLMRLHFAMKILNSDMGA